MKDKQLDLTIHFWETTKKEYGPLCDISTVTQIELTIAYLKELREQKEKK